MHDTRIVDELRAIHHGRNAKGKIIKIDGKVPVGMRMSLDRFADAITLSDVGERRTGELVTIRASPRVRAKPQTEIRDGMVAVLSIGKKA
jgi:hypothetical protein